VAAAAVVQEILHQVVHQEQAVSEAAEQEQIVQAMEALE
jgi:hypothetical protein